MKNCEILSESGRQKYEQMLTKIDGPRNIYNAFS